MATLDPQLQQLLGPWGFHLDLLGTGSQAPPWPWDGEEPEPAVRPAARPAEAVAQGPVRQLQKKAERRGGGLARGFLNRTGGAAEGRGNSVAETKPQPAAGSSTARKKKPAAGHYWSTPPTRYQFPQERELSVEEWKGVEQFGELEKPTKAGVCRFYRLPGFVPTETVNQVLSHCKQTQAYKMDTDSVDQTPTFEYYPFKDGEWVDRQMQTLLQGTIEDRILPYLRERYNCRFCALADILVRRYIPGERRTHAVHFDGHAFITALLGLTPPEDYEGGIYLQPEAAVSSRTFLYLEPGDLVAHSFDLQHGVHVWKGERYSLIFWVKDSLRSVREHTTPWHDKLAEQDDPDGLYNIAQNYEYGMFGKPLDLPKALELYEKSARAGHHFAQNNLGLLHRKAHEASGGSSGSLQKSFEWLKVAAEGGFAMAQKNLAIAFANGHGVRRDDVRAASWMRKAAEQLEVEAAYMMGELYRQGRGLPADAGEAMKWYERSAEAGFPKAQYTLGMLYLDGTGTKKDMQMAELWMRFAAKQGNQEAKNNLATMHAQRGEVEQAAEIWAELAAAGEVNAQCNLGMCFMRGMGRPRDLHEARRWLAKAADQGHQMALQALMQLSTMADD